MPEEPVWLRSAGGWDNRRIESIDVEGQVDIIRDPFQRVIIPCRRSLCELAPADFVRIERRDPILPDEIRFFAALGPDADLHQPPGVEDFANPGHDGGMAVLIP